MTQSTPPRPPDEIAKVAEQLGYWAGRAQEAKPADIENLAKLVAELARWVERDSTRVQVDLD